MRKISFVLLFIVGLGQLTAQEIQWMSLNEALEAQKREPKKIFMDAYANWCGPCKLLDEHTFSHQDVAAFINEHFYPVKFNAEGNEVVVYQGQEFSNPQFNPERVNGRNSQHELAQALGINSYPTMIFFDEAGAPLGPVYGYQEPRDLEVYLTFFLEDKYEEITSAKDFWKYQRKFKHSFGK